MWDLIHKMAYAIWRATGYPRETLEIASPKGIVKEDDIAYDKTKKVLTISNLNPPVLIPYVANTNSMEPLIDEGDSVILSQDFKHNDLIIGDIVVYEAANMSILHRIIEIDETNDGQRLYTCRGDNTAGSDPYTISSEQIKWYVVGVIYCKKER